jgi:hypothetical protein
MGPAGGRAEGAAHDLQIDAAGKHIECGHADGDGREVEVASRRLGQRLRRDGDVLGLEVDPFGFEVAALEADEEGGRAGRGDVTRDDARALGGGGWWGCGRLGLGRACGGRAARGGGCRPDGRAGRRGGRRPTRGEHEQAEREQAQAVAHSHGLPPS